MSQPVSGAESANPASDSDAGANKKRSVDVSSSSSLNASPRRLYNQNKVFRMAARPRQQGGTLRDDSQEESLENDSDLDSTVCINNSGSTYNKDDDVLYQLVKAIFFVCIEVPVE